MQEQTITITSEFIKLEGLLKFDGVMETGGEDQQAIQEREVSVIGNN